jgi:predicted ABC-type ATPase
VPRLLVLAGPNGAGKTTFAQQILAREIAAGDFLNADDIARELNPDSVEEAALEAGRALIRDRRNRIRQGRSFAVETTLSGRGLLRDLELAAGSGFQTELHFLFAPNPNLCIERVTLRVQRGGHGVPADVVARRFFRGLALLPLYMDAVDRSTVWDVSARPRPIVHRVRGRVAVLDGQAWRTLLALSSGPA